MFENQYRSYVLENPYFESLARQGITLESSFGVMHPSQTNYIASIAGELCNVTDDDAPDPPLPQRTVVDLIEDAGLEWKAYMDGYAPDADGSPPADRFPYVDKHNPFSSFSTVIDRPERLTRIVGESQFWIDVAAGTLPEYCWFTPDMWNDGHYLRGTTVEPEHRAPKLVDQSAEWLEWFFGTIKFPGPDSLLPDRTLVVVTFDESDFEKAWETTTRKGIYDGPNQIYSVLLGTEAKPRRENSEGYNHYSLLRTIEENFSLGSLDKNDADANWFRFLWDKAFVWSEATPTPFPLDASVSLVGVGDDLVAVVADPSGSLATRTWSDGVWSDAADTGFATAGGAQLGAIVDTVTLVFLPDPQTLVATVADRDGSWSQPSRPLNEGLPVQDFALASCNRGTDLMLCFVSDGAVYSVHFSQGEWGSLVDTGHITSGPINLAALGHNLFLTLVGPVGAELQAASYGTADFNTTSLKQSKYSGPKDNAVANHWCPTPVPVGHYASAASRRTPWANEPDLQPYATLARSALVSFGGVLHLVFQPANADADHLSDARFSIAGVLTPELPISFNAVDKTSTSNGHGTLFEAGWAVPQVVPGAEGSRIVCGAASAQQATLLLRAEGVETMHMVHGSYT